MSQEKAVLGKVALVTGAAQGMGKAIALRLAEQGAGMVISDMDGNKAKQTADEIKAHGYRALGMKVDVTEEKEISGMVDTAMRQFGTVDILVNSAGVLRPTGVEKISEEEWDLVMDVNLKGVFLCSKAVLSIMKNNKYGRIVNLSSSAGKNISTLGGAHYTASKAGVLGLTRHMAKELAPYGITVNAVCPGLIDTEMVRQNCSPERLKNYENSFPVSRLGTPEEVADLVLFLASDKSSYITGASIDINGGDLMI